MPRASARGRGTPGGEAVPRAPAFAEERFFADENQIISLAEVGEPQIIRGRAKRIGADFRKFLLAGQFLCNGSASYLSCARTLQSPTPLDCWRAGAGPGAIPAPSRTKGAPRVGDGLRGPLARRSKGRFDDCIAQAKPRRP